MGSLCRLMLEGEWKFEKGKENMKEKHIGKKNIKMGGGRERHRESKESKGRTIKSTGRNEGK